MLEARTVVRRAAHALAARNDEQLDHDVVSPLPRATVVSPLPRKAGAETDDPERARAVASLEASANGAGRAFGRARVRGPLGLEVALEHGAEGWRVDPSSLGVVLPTPTAALQQLIAALDRLPNDPAFALLSHSMRDTIVTAAAERARGLRELLPRLSTHANGRLPMQLEYGEGLFVVLRQEDGGWRIDDFN